MATLIVTIPSHPPTGATCRTHHLAHLSSEKWKLRLPTMQFLTASIQQWFWIFAIKKLFKSVIQCMKCYHFKVQTSQQLMVELPHLRMQPSRPFTTTGVDSAGPILQWSGKQHSHPGLDKHITIMTHATPRGTLKWPMVKMCSLPLHGQHHDL
jgi:hypothetical protein